MKKFELCFSLEDDVYVIPELLAESKPELHWNFKDNLRCEYHYEFMPAGIITRLISRNHKLLKPGFYWRHGLILENNATTGLIINEAMGRKIKVWISGEHQKELLKFIRSELSHIHKTLNQPDYQEWIPCTCEECLFNSEPYLFNYEKLLKARERNITKLLCENSFTYVSIDRILTHSETTFDKVIEFLGHYKGDIAEIVGRFARGYLDQ
jgi:hypothetical protein